MPCEELPVIDVSALTRNWKTVKRRYNSKSFGNSGFETMGSRSVSKNGHDNPVVGDLPWSSPDEVLWLKSENYYEYEEGMGEDFFDGDVHGVDKKGRVLWVEYETYYIEHFDELESFFSKNGKAIARLMDEMYKPGPTTFPRDARDVDGLVLERMDHVKITFYEFHGDTSELTGVVSRIVENERACRG